MRTPFVHIAIAALAFGALTACAPTAHVATTSTTAADVVDPAPPVAREDSAAVVTAAPETSSAAAAAGELTCKTKDAFGVVTELYVDGEKGMLRRLPPSGELEEKPLKVAHLGNVIFADEPTSEDLAVHAVTVRHAQGKTFLRLGDWNQDWSACQ